MLGYFLVVILHRIGVIILVTATGVMISLPHIFQQDEDLDFALKISSYLNVLSKISVLFLVLTGIFRLIYGIPVLFFLKVPAVLVVIYLYFVVGLDFDQYLPNQYSRISIIRLVSVIITGFIGLYL